ncbi:MAG: hypothetical protein PHU33_16630 [Bacteroidales bacterium]|nr:hypothetical protein [Bacteroidales bacterium]
MAFIQYLVFDNVNIPLPTSYDLNLSTIVADSSGETEAGTIQRDIIRTGVVEITVSFLVSSFWLIQLSQFAKQDSISVQYFDPVTIQLKSTSMYIDGYAVKLEKDTSFKSLWSVTFTLKEF